MEAKSEIKSIQDRRNNLVNNERFREEVGNEFVNRKFSLNELQEQKAANKLNRPFIAVIEGKMFVADSNMVSVWQETSDGKLEFLDAIDWSEIDTQEIRNASQFEVYDWITSYAVEEFHDKVTVLFSMYRLFSRLGSSSGNYYDDEGGEIVPHIRYIDGLQKAMSHQVQHILNWTPSNYENWRPHIEHQLSMASYDANRQQREVSRLQSKLRRLDNPDIEIDEDLEFFRNLR